MWRLVRQSYSGPCSAVALMWSDLLAVLLSLAATASTQSIGQTILNKLATGFKETLQRGKT